MSKNKNISSIVWEDMTSPPVASRRNIRRRVRKPVNVIRRMSVSALAVLIGLAMMIAPLATNYLEYQQYCLAVNKASAAVIDASRESLVDALDAAYQYNEQLASNRTPSVEEYDSLLNLSDTGVMALLRLPKLDIVLPIYHSGMADDEVHGVVQVGPSNASRGSSLPVGGPSTHALISNVNSLPSTKQFSQITELGSGDRISIAVCGEELTYEIYETKMTSFADASNMNIVQGEDLVTLVLAEQGNDESRFVIKAKRSAMTNNIYLGSYNPTSFQDVFRIVFMNMSIPQGALFVVGTAIVMFFFVRFVTSMSDRTPKEVGRLIGDSG